MKYQSAEEQYRKYLNSLPLMTLRPLGRELGVPQSCSRLKDNLVEVLVGILTGDTTPAPKTKKGARPKQTYVDPSIYHALEEIKKSAQSQKIVMQVRSDEAEDCDYNLSVASGILELNDDGSGYVRVNRFLPSEKDVYLSPALIEGNCLRNGNRIAVTVSSRITERLTAVRVLSIEEREISQCELATPFESLTACYPTDRIALSDAKQSFVRMTDALLPIGKGQRVFIATERRGGITSFLKAYAQAIDECCKDVTLFYLSLDQPPEGLFSFSRSEIADRVVATSLDHEPSLHIRTAKLVFERAKRLVERGKHVVIIFDSLNALVRAYRHQIPDNQFNQAAYMQIKRLLGLAHNTVEGGSVTLFACFENEGEDAAACRELSELGNAYIVFTKSGTIDFAHSYVLSEQITQSDEEKTLQRYFQENALTYAQICDLFEKYPNNRALLEALTQ